MAEKDGIGIMIAKAVPPPDKLKKGDPDDGGDMGSGDEDDDRAAELSAMEEFEKADSTEAKLDAFKNLIAICKGY